MRRNLDAAKIRRVHRTITCAFGRRRHLAPPGQIPSWPSTVQEPAKKRIETPYRHPVFGVLNRTISRSKTSTRTGGSFSEDETFTDHFADETFADYFTA